MTNVLPGQSVLDQRLLTDALAIVNPGVSWAMTNRDRQLFYPAWMEGTWEVSSAVLHETAGQQV